MRKKESLFALMKIDYNESKRCRGGETPVQRIDCLLESFDCLIPPNNALKIKTQVIELDMVLLEKHNQNYIK